MVHGIGYTCGLMILSIILLLWCLALGSYWLIALLRVSHVVRNRPTILAGLNLPEPSGGWPSLSIIVPAHNEARVIDACATSLRNLAYPNLQITFVLDRCTDHTRAILAQHEHDERIVIVENDSCPDDWAGKCNAAHIGAQHATGEYVLFTDADTQFHADLARAAVAMAHHRDIKLLSVLSSLTYTQKHECIAQPVATLALMRMFPLVRWSKGKSLRPFANGQFMLFDRAAYDAIGGHGAVKDDLLEDLAFARLMQRNGDTPGVFLADGLLVCSMYDSLAEFCQGWKRIFIEACRRKVRRLRSAAWRLMVLGVINPLMQLTAVAVAVMVDSSLLRWSLLAAVIWSVAMQFFTLMRVYRLSGAPLAGILGYSVGSWIVARLMFQGADDLEQQRAVRWGGREYILTPRS
jgi:chlorobactene glucosyltransferase